jgi:ketosteroid isomerase-like protein
VHHRPLTTMPFNSGQFYTDEFSMACSCSTSHLQITSARVAWAPDWRIHNRIKEDKVMSKTLSLMLVLLLVTIGHARADPLTEDMTKLNAQWDAAINDPNFDALLPMYAADASLMPPGAAPVSSPAAIRDFFAKRGTSVRNHRLELVEILQMGVYAYVTSRFKASLVRGEETTMLSGSTVKLYEHQANGEWKVKSHIFVRE